MTTVYRDIAELDSEISRLEHRLIQLRRTRNNMMKLVQMPNEILARILECVQQQNRHSQPRSHLCIPDRHIGPQVPYWPKKDDAFTNAIMVCSRLREVAISSRRLWSNINLDYKHHQWYELCLERAAGHSLTLCGTLPGSQSLHSALRLIELIDLAHYVRLVITDPFADTPKFPWVDNKADVIQRTREVMANIQMILFASQRAISVDIHNRCWEFLHVGSRFMSGGLSDPHQPPATGITQLYLHRCHLAGMPGMPSLKQLTLHETRCDSRYEQLRVLLSRTPLLSDLCIREPSWIYDAVANTDTRGTLKRAAIVTLPFLNTLDVSGGCCELNRILKVVPDPKKHLVLHIKRHICDDDGCHPDASIVNDSGSILKRVAPFLDSSAQEQLSASHILHMFRSRRDLNTNLGSVRLEPRPALDSSKRISAIVEGRASVGWPEKLSTHIDQVVLCGADLAYFAARVNCKSMNVNKFVIQALDLGSPPLVVEPTSRSTILPLVANNPSPPLSIIDANKDGNLSNNINPSGDSAQDSDDEDPVPQLSHMKILERAFKTGMQVRTLELLYFMNMGLPLPTKEEQDAAQQTWQGSGYASEVAWKFIVRTVQVFALAQLADHILRQ